MLGSLVVALSANVAQFQSDLGRASQVAENEMRKINAAVDTVKSALAGFASAFISAEAFGAVKDKVADVVHQMAELDDAAEKTGASVESLSSLLNTLKPSGANLGTVTDMAEKMVKAMQGADKETAKAAEAFDALGIKTRDAAGNLRPADDVIRDVANALYRYEDGANKTAIAQALLGKAGAQFLPLLKDIATTTPVAASVTTEMAAEAERLEKAFGSLKVAGEAWWQTMVSKIVPGLATLVEQFNLARRSGMGLWDALNTIPGPNSNKKVQIDAEQKAIDDLIAKRDKLSAASEKARARGDGNGFVDEEVKRLDKEISERGKRLDILQRQAVQVALAEDANLNGPEQSVFGRKQAPRLKDPEKPQTMSEGERLIRSLEQRLAAVMKLTEAQKLEYEIATKLVSLTPQEAARARVKAQQIDSVNEMMEAQKRELDFEQRTESAARRSTETVAKYIEAQRKKGESFKELIDPAEQYRKKLEDLDALEDAYISSADRQQARGKLLAQIFDAQYGMKENVNKTNELGKQLGNTFESMFENAIIKGKAFSDVLKGLADDILRLVLRQQVSGPIANWVSGLLGGGQATYNGYITGGLRTGSVWSGMDGENQIEKSVNVVQHMTFGSDVNTTTLAAWGQNVKAQTLKAVKEIQKRT